MTTDSDIRKCLNNQLKKQHDGHSEKTIIINELGICGDVRIDIAVINGCLTGYEIKSAKDNLKRLPNQAFLYNKVFDYLHLIAAPEHVSQLDGKLPEHWGIQTVIKEKGRLKFEVVRNASINPETEPSFLVQMLWRDEALSLLESFNIVEGYRSKPKRLIWNKIAESIPEAEIKKFILGRIKMRNEWIADRQLTICGG